MRLVSTKRLRLHVLFDLLHVVQVQLMQLLRLLLRSLVVVLMLHVLLLRWHRLQRLILYARRPKGMQINA